MGLQLDLNALPREVQHPLEQIASTFPLGAEDLRNNGVTDAKLATKIIRGEITGAAGITRGTGFSVVRNVAGDYTVTFTTAFAATPVIVLTCGSAGSAQIAKLHASTAPTASAFRVATLTTAAALADSDFDFIAISV